jgi:hypothetical protein
MAAAVAAAAVAVAAMTLAAASQLVEIGFADGHGCFGNLRKGAGGHVH